MYISNVYFPFHEFFSHIHMDILEVGLLGKSKVGTIFFLVERVEIYHKRYLTTIDSKREFVRVRSRLAIVSLI